MRAATPFASADPRPAVMPVCGWLCLLNLSGWRLNHDRRVYELAQPGLAHVELHSQHGPREPEAAGTDALIRHEALELALRNSDRTMGCWHVRHPELKCAERLASVI